MNRRDFFKALAGAAAGVSVRDPLQSIVTMLTQPAGIPDLTKIYFRLVRMPLYDSVMVQPVKWMKGTLYGRL